MWIAVSFIFGTISFVLPRLAVAALLHRILNLNRIRRIILWGLVTLVAIVSFVNIVIYFTICNPPEALWKTWMISTGVAKCRDARVLINYCTFSGGKLYSMDLMILIEVTD